MESNKPVEVPEENRETYTPSQRAFFKILQWGAWAAIVVAMLRVMRT